MKKLMENTLVKFLAALLCAALLLGTIWYGIWGVLCSIMPAESVAYFTLQQAMNYDTRSVLWYEDELRQILESEEQDWSKASEYVRENFDPAVTNFRFVVFRDAETVLSNYNDEHQVAKNVHWEEVFLGTTQDVRLMNSYENGQIYDYENDRYLPERGDFQYEVQDRHNLPEEYAYYDEKGYLYDAEGNLLAYVENYAEVFEQGYVPEFSFVLDGTTYYPVDPAVGYPEEFAYEDANGNFYDTNLNCIAHQGGDGSRIVVNSTPVPTPTPMPMPATESGQPVGTPSPSADTEDDLKTEPVIIAVNRLTEEDYTALREKLYNQVIVHGFIVMSEKPAVDENGDALTDDAGNPLVLHDFAVEDRYSQIYDRMMHLCATNGGELEVAVVFGVLAILLLIFLMMAAGHRRTEEGDEIVLRVIDRMPWDLWLCFVAAGAALAFGGVYFGAMLVEPALYETIELFDLVLLYWILVAALTLAFCVWMLMSFAARVKVKGWWRNCLCWKLLVICWKWTVKIVKWCWKLWKKLWNGTKSVTGRFVRGIPLVWKATVVLAAVSLAEFIFLVANAYGGWILVGLMWIIVQFVGCMVICLMLKQLQQGARTIADGDLDYRIDTRRMAGDFKEHAECLNRIGDGLSRSVESQLRAERMKTELITNVSHDLKTPLTSIVNYVDLLKKQQLQGTVAEYVDVLDRQSARLKKLTEDLVEASKASSGSLQVNTERVSLTELIEQARAEYAPRLEAVGLQTIVRLPKGEVNVWADGKYVWRILDNLLSNVCKYAMPNTRVYLELRVEDDRAVMSVKNMSRESLNISAEELMERFVRGDSSRNTEGSGLGLSIAQSLAKLMGGEVGLTIDGDLFKAEVTLPLAK